MSKLWRNVGAATVGLGCAVSLSAQTVRGVVVLPDDAPAPGVIVTAVVVSAIVMVRTPPE